MQLEIVSTGMIQTIKISPWPCPLREPGVGVPTLLYMLHALLTYSTYSTFILASPDSVRLTGLLCRISHRISTDTFLSCTLILTPLKTFILYVMLDIFCLASIHANRCQYQRSDLLQCFHIRL